MRSAKLRMRARREQRGAILFVVAMTLALLGALGVYALGAATSEIKTSGYARQAAQTHYISEYGTIAMLDAFSPQNASYFDAQMVTTAPTDPNACKSNLALNAARSTNIASRCAKVPQAYFATSWKGGAGSDLVVKPDSLAPSGQSKFTPRFTSELTDPISGGFQPGFDVNNGKCFRRYTITTYGQLLNDGATMTLGREIGRARVTTGPFDCGG